MASLTDEMFCRSIGYPEPAIWKMISTDYSFHLNEEDIIIFEDSDEYLNYAESAGMIPVSIFTRYDRNVQHYNGLVIEQ